MALSLNSGIETADSADFTTCRSFEFDKVKAKKSLAMFLSQLPTYQEGISEIVTHSDWIIAFRMTSKRSQLLSRSLFISVAAQPSRNAVLVSARHLTDGTLHER